MTLRSSTWSQGARSHTGRWSSTAAGSPTSDPPARATERGAETPDVRGRTVLPGLIDAHVHVKAWHADLGIVPRRPASYTALKAAGLLEAMLRRGFTTVRDAGGADAGLAAAVADGTIPGPRLFFCGHAISQTGGHGDAREAGDDRHAGAGDGLSRIADGVDAVRQAARDELRRGAHFIKVMVSGGISSPTDRLGSLQYSPDELAAFVEEATNAGRYVTGHAYTAASVTRAARAGFRCVEHANLIDAAHRPVDGREGDVSGRHAGHVRGAGDAGVPTRGCRPTSW